jgi:hypothetical protein
MSATDACNSQDACGQNRQLEISEELRNPAAGS